MAETTLEEAKKCPKCNQPGEMDTGVALPQGGRMHFVFCRNALCIWLDTNWMLQVRADGSIPNRLDEQGPNEFIPRSNDFLAMGQRIVEDAVGKDLREP